GENLEVLDEAGKRLDALGQSADRSSGALSRFLGGYGSSGGRSGAADDPVTASTALTLQRAGEIQLETAQSHALIIHAASASYADKVQKAGDALLGAADSAAKVFNTLSAAFGTNPTTRIGTEVGQGFEQDIAAQRQKVVRQYGANSQQVSAFDANAGQALDSYKIATGQATQASLEFDAMLKLVHQEAASGKISFDAEAVALAAMAQAAEHGKTSLSDLTKLQYDVKALTDSTGFNSQYNTNVHLHQARSGGQDSSPFYETGKSADSATAKITDVTKAADTANSHLAAIGPAGLQAGNQAGAGMDTIAAKAQAANAVASVLLGTLQEIRALAGS
ncbi:MAG TPA: hypothetical protein VKQ72_03875, partial [Aggregatilineales bacterium]|nr:hypothetical protein [Aggregatilineales bacterium]